MTPLGTLEKYVQLGAEDNSFLPHEQLVSCDHCHVLLLRRAFRHLSITTSYAEQTIKININGL